MPQTENIFPDKGCSGPVVEGGIGCCKRIPTLYVYIIACIYIYIICIIYIYICIYIYIFICIPLYTDVQGMHRLLVTYGYYSTGNKKQNEVSLVNRGSWDV